MKIQLLLLASLTVYQTDASFQCDLTKCKLMENKIVKGLECLIEERRENITALAETYLALFNECLERFKGSCIYLGNLNYLNCACEFNYIARMKLNMKRNECKDVSQLDYSQWTKSQKYQEHLKDILLLIEESRRCSPSFSPRKMLPFGKSDGANQSMELRRSETFQVCTCDSDKCDPTKSRAGIMSTAVHENTTKPDPMTESTDGAGNEQGSSTKKDGANGAKGQDKSINLILTICMLNLKIFTK